MYCVHLLCTFANLGTGMILFVCKVLRGCHTSYMYMYVYMYTCIHVEQLTIALVCSLHLSIHWYPTQVGMTIHARILTVNVEKFSVDLTCRSSDLKDSEGRFRSEFTMPEVK